MRRKGEKEENHYRLKSKERSRQRERRRTVSCKETEKGRE